MAVALFDLDRTLIDCNSGRLWLALEWREGRVGIRDAAWASYILLQYSLGYGELDAAYNAAVAKYAGIPEVDIDTRTRDWFAREVAHRLRPGARAAVEQHRKQGDRLVIATSSTMYAGQQAAAAFGFETTIASRFEVADDGRFTGKVSHSAFGANKLTRVAEWAEREGVLLSDCTFYTDSASDLALMEKVGHPVAVNPDRALAKIAVARNWPIVDWGLSVSGAAAAANP